MIYSKYNEFLLTMNEKYGNENKNILIIKEQQIDIKNMLVKVYNKIKKFSINFNE